MQQIISQTISTLIPKGLSVLLKPALLMLFLVVMGSAKLFGQVVEVEVLDHTPFSTNVQNNSLFYNVPQGPSRMMLVMVSNANGQTVSTITFNGTSLAPLITGDNSQDARTHIYRFLNPPTGVGNLVVNFSGAVGRGAVIGVVTLGNVNQANSIPYFASTSGTSAVISHSVTSASGQMVFQVVGTRQSPLTTTGSGQTELWNLRPGASEHYGGASNKPATGTTTTMTWDRSAQGNSWSMSLVSVDPACITASVSVTNPTCAGGPNGEITISDPIGAAFYEYRLDAGTWQSSNTFTGLDAGTYAVSIRDANDTTCEVNLGSYIITTDPVLFDAASSDVFITGTTVTLNHTTGSGENRLMLVGISTRSRYITVPAAGEEASTVSYDGNNLIYLGHEQSNSDAVTYLFMLPDPPSGIAQLSVDFTAALGSSNAAVVGITTYSNVDLTNPVGSYFSSPGNDANPTLTITNTKTNQIVYNVLAATDAAMTVTANSGQTQRWFHNSYRPTGAGYTRAGAATSTTFNYTLNDGKRWSLSGIAINPVLVADLEVTKTINEPNPYVGQEITFTLTATNLGCDDAPNVTVLDQLPDGYIYASHSTATGTFSPGNGVWDIGTLDTGVSATLEITAVVTNTDNYNNSATISGNVVDNNTANNTANATITVCQAGGTQPLFNN